MHKLAEGSLGNRAFVALLSVVIAVLGVFSMSTLRQELIPRVELPVVQIVTLSPGATSEQMTDRVSVPIEQQLSTIPELANSTTNSSSSFSIVMAEFDYGTDIARATNKVELALSRANTNFPENAETQVISGGTSDIPLSYVAISSDGSALETADRIRTTVVPELEKIDGVAQVELIGAPEQVVRISLDQERVRELEISTDAIQQALEDNGLAVPVGSMTEGDTTMDVTVGNRLESVEALRDLPIVAEQTEETLPDGTTVPGPAVVYPLSEIATVELAAGENSLVGRLDGTEAVALVLYPTADANIVDTTDQVNAKLAELEPAVGGNTQFNTLFEQAPFITDSIRSLTEEGILGLIFAVIIIFLFLMSLRSTLVAAISIPLSLLVGFIGMLIFGYSLNMLTLAALTLSIGRVVDDSIVVIENIKRHLEYGKPKREAILDAVKEVSSAVTTSTVVSAIVFVPVGLVPGLVGELFRPFAFTVVIAMVASLFVALTIVPVLAYWFLKVPKEVELAKRAGELEQYQVEVEKREDRYWLRRIYRPAFNATQRHPAVTLVVAVVILAITVALVPQLKINLLGSTNRGIIFVTQEVTPGTSMDAQVKEADKVDAALQEVDGVESVATIIGTSGLGTTGINYLVAVDETLDLDEITSDVMDAAGTVVDRDSLESADTSFIGGGTVDVDITAPDDATLQAATDQVATELATLPEVTAVDHNLRAEAPAVQVTVDRDVAASLGLTENDVVGLIAAQMVSPEIGSITIENIDTSIYLSIDNPITSVDELRNMEIMGMPLTDIATVDEVKSIPTIVTKNGQTTATVSVTPATADDLGATTTAVENAVGAMDLPDGVVTNMAGAAEQLTDSFSKVILSIIAAILLIYVALVWVFKSLLQPLLLLVSIPFAAIGSFTALLLTDSPLDLSAMIGLLMLTGIVVTNAVVLIDLINQYRERGMPLDEAIRNGTMRRLRPIVMTALATIAAMIPMALGLSSSSGFISQPLAITVIGGLVTSTLLTLVLLPVLYRLVEGAKERRVTKNTVVSA